MIKNQHSDDPIITKLQKTLTLSVKNRSNYWQRQLENGDPNNKMNATEIYNINKTGGWGNFTKKHFIKSTYNRIKNSLWESSYL